MWLEIQSGRAALPKALVRDPELAPCGLWPVPERLWYHVFGPYLVETADSYGLVSFAMHSSWLRGFLPTFCENLDAAGTLLGSPGERLKVTFDLEFTLSRPRYLTTSELERTFLSWQRMQTNVARLLRLLFSWCDIVQDT